MINNNSLISPEDLVGMHHEIFEDDWEMRRFRNPYWSVEHLDASLRLTEGNFDKIKLLCEKWNDELVVITDIEPIPPHQFMMILSPNIQELTRAYSTLLGHFETHVFGKSKKWGLICTLEEGCYLGQE